MLDSEGDVSTTIAIPSRPDVLNEVLHRLDAPDHAEVLKLINELERRRVEMGRMRSRMQEAVNVADAARIEAMKYRQAAQTELAARLAAEEELLVYTRFCNVAAQDASRASPALGEAIRECNAQQMATAIDALRPVQLRIEVRGPTAQHEGTQADAVTLDLLRTNFSLLADTVLARVRGNGDGVAGADARRSDDASAEADGRSPSHGALNLVGLLDGVDADVGTDADELALELATLAATSSSAMRSGRGAGAGAGAGVGPGGKARARTGRSEPGGIPPAGGRLRTSGGLLLRRSSQLLELATIPDGGAKREPSKTLPSVLGRDRTNGAARLSRACGSLTSLSAVMESPAHRWRGAGGERAKHERGEETDGVGEAREIGSWGADQPVERPAPMRDSPQKGLPARLQAKGSFSFGSASGRGAQPSVKGAERGAAPSAQS
ncbi:hypothetical protein KFE25_001145 [Diacronema lutheri]|uniref:Uncharacterized protein n=1 Tax=Diacronema lutheri TaxID=2081491 RepID=A0A8J6C829_DIALT|nr:hypothetical protein KFE25_001145 [Diacronema lutheri]